MIHLQALRDHQVGPEMKDLSLFMKQPVLLGTLGSTRKKILGADTEEAQFGMLGVTASHHGSRVM